MAECYVRGSTIKYLRIPDEVIDMVKEEAQMRARNRQEAKAGRFQQNQRQNYGNNRGQNRGGNRGGGGGGSGGSGGSGAGSGTAGQNRGNFQNKKPFQRT